MKISVCELIALFRRFQPRVDHGHHHHRKIVSASIFFQPIGAPMAKATLHADDNGVSAALVLKDKHGNIVTPNTPPTWTMSDDTIVDMTVAADGLSAQFAPKGPAGTLTVDVLVDADTGPGVTDLHATGDIEVLPANVATAEVTFGQVT